MGNKKIEIQVTTCIYKYFLRMKSDKKRKLGKYPCSKYN